MAMILIIQYKSAAQNITDEYIIWQFYDYEITQYNNVC